MLRFAFILLLAPAFLAAGKPFDFEAMMRIVRISDPQLSPDGKQVVYSAQTVSLDANTKVSQIYLVPMEGGGPRQLTVEGGNERARWSPDGKSIAFVSTRGGSSQLWMMQADGSEQRPVTSLGTEASGVLFFPDGKHLLFVSEVYPDCTDQACNERRLQEEKAAKTKARVYTSLLYRHWTTWQSKRRSHLLTIAVEGGEVKDLTPGPRDVPTFALGGADGYAIAPDSKEVAYVMNADAEPAFSTNSDIYTVSVEDRIAAKVSTSAGADVTPSYSPNGLFLAWRSQKTAGYESDRWRLFVLERSGSKLKDLTEALNRNVESFAWAPDSNRMFYTIEDRGRQSVQMTTLNAGGARGIVSGNGSYDDLEISPDGKTILYTMNSGAQPLEIYRVAAGGTPVPLTRMNDALLAEYSLPRFEEISTVGAENAKVASFVLKPPDFDATKKYPVLFLIHGGPQGAWQEAWSYRWNPQIFAAKGFVVVMPNPRGSTGYGQKFTDEINNDWGGKPYEDIMATVDWAAAQPWADADRFAAAGGSYGGYMVNWILGHTNRFKALVSHAGVFDLRSMAGETEESWFPMWEFHGMPWDNPESYSKWSPSYYVNDFQTPTLVIHGDLDYRVPEGQGMQLFTALQAKNVPSKLLLFPDEGHWILKPQNSALWYTTVLDWVGEWTAKKPSKP